MIPGKNLTWEEEKAIEELQVRVKKDLPASLSDDDLVFYRFLKARDFDVNKAEQMLRKHFHWRKANQIDTILEDFKPKECFIKHIKVSPLGFDKVGDLVIYIPAGNMDGRDILKCIKMNDYIRHWIWNFEKYLVLNQEENEKTGRHSYQATLIFDLDKLTFSNATSRASVDAVLRTLSILQDNYPEFLKALYIINTPAFFVITFSILKGIMSKATLEKFKLFGRSGWKENMVESVGEDVLPAFLGGYRTDPDGNPMCNTFVSKGGKIPKIYHLSSEDRYFKDPSQINIAKIPAIEKKEIQVQITEKGSLIEWEYLVQSKDIGFGINFHTAEGQVERILPIEKISTTDGTETGFYKCKKVGR